MHYLCAFQKSKDICIGIHHQSVGKSSLLLARSTDQLLWFALGTDGSFCATLFKISYSYFLPPVQNSIRKYFREKKLLRNPRIGDRYCELISALKFSSMFDLNFTASGDHMITIGSS
jgi:hypothetical protein